MAPGYRELIAEYMQNGSLGRRINIEARAYDDRVEFRYVIPRSTMLDEILIEDEATEFNLSAPAEISETPIPNFPRMTVVDGAAHLAPGPNGIAFTGRTPLICPWRRSCLPARRAILRDRHAGIRAGIPRATG